MTMVLSIHAADSSCLLYHTGPHSCICIIDTIILITSSVPLHDIIQVWLYGTHMHEFDMHNLLIYYHDYVLHIQNICNTV